MTPVAVFDVNETLLDVSALQPRFTELMGPAVGLGEWFARLLHRSVVANQLDAYRPFGELGAGALAWLAAREGVETSPVVVDEIVAGMADLPPHGDVEPGLELLADAGVTMIALTNSSAGVAAHQVANAGLARFFERVLSVEAIGRFKPAPEVYAYAAESCGVDPDRMVMVAAHDWDIAGAQAAGLHGCFVARQPWGMGGVVPDMRIERLTDLAAALEVRWTP